MSRKFVVVLLAFLLACNPPPVQRNAAEIAPGTPRSLDFGYGARLNTTGPYLDSSLRLAARMNIDWIALDFDWSATQPEPGTWNETSSFSNAILLAHSLKLEALVSVKNPPSWALTVNGPDTKAAVALITSLVSRHPSLDAVELFPGANTRSGWGAVPSARAYAQLFKAVQTRLENEKPTLYLVAGGLQNTLTAPEDLPDTLFLEQLYAAGLRPDILSIQLRQLTGNSLDAPTPNSLRHYEDLRAVMVANGHADGLLWITGFSLPTASQDQTWLAQAYAMMQSQLYLGTVFYDALNPPSTDSLVGQDGRLQPACFSLLAVINTQRKTNAKLTAHVNGGRLK